MAERRMFAKSIIDSDAFLDMPLSTQSLYFHLSMRADDDGFVNNPKRIQKTIGASDDDLKLLIAKKFIIPFESGVVVIKHWKIHNYIQKDRYHKTNYTEERALLTTQKNGSYSLLDTECIQNGYSLDTEVRLGKDSLDKDSQDKATYGRFKPPTLEEVSAYVKEKGYHINPETFFYHYASKNWMIGKNKMVSWHMAVGQWESRWKEEHGNNEGHTGSVGNDHGSNEEKPPGYDLIFGS